MSPRKHFYKDDRHSKEKEELQIIQEQEKSTVHRVHKDISKSEKKLNFFPFRLLVLVWAVCNLQSTEIPRLTCVGFVNILNNIAYLSNCFGSYYLGRQNIAIWEATDVHFFL